MAKRTIFLASAAIVLAAFGVAVLSGASAAKRDALLVERAVIASAD